MSLSKHLIRALIFWAGLAAIIILLPPESLFAVTMLFILLPLALFSSLVYPISAITSRFRSQNNPKIARRRAWIISIGISLLAFIRFIQLDTKLNTATTISLMFLIELYLSQSIRD